MVRHNSVERCARRCLWLALAVLISLAAPTVRADQLDPRLDKLFVILNKTRDAEQAARAQAEIERIWLESPVSGVNRLMAQGFAALSEGDVRSALAKFGAAIELAPEFAEAPFQRARVRFAARRYLEAIADAEQALALEPRHYHALIGLGEIYMLIGDAEGALRVFEQALAINPHLNSVRAAADDLRRERDRNRL